MRPIYWALLALVVVLAGTLLFVRPDRQIAQIIFWSEIGIGLIVVLGVFFGGLKSSVDAEAKIHHGPLP